jgi:hypothetical protein
MNESIILKLVNLLSGANPTDNKKLFAITDQSQEIRTDLLRALNPSQSKFPEDIELGLPIQKDITIGNTVPFPYLQSQINVVELKINNLLLKYDILIIKVNDDIAMDFNIYGNLYNIEDLKMKEGINTGRTLFPYSLINIDGSSARSEYLINHSDFLKHDYPRDKLIICIYRNTKLKESFFIADEAVSRDATTAKLVKASTSVTLLHELFIHAIPASINEKPFYEPNYPNPNFITLQEKINAIERRGFEFANR